MNDTTVNLFSIVVLVVLTLIVPAIGIWDFRRLLSWIAAGHADARMKSYRWILIMEWAMVLGFTGWWILAGRGLAPLGLLPSAAGWQWLAIGLGIAATIYMVWQMGWIIGSSEKLAEARNEMGDLAELAPQSAQEFRLFSAVAVTAGVCEEILYRGVLLATLVPLIGTWPAVILSSLIFGLGHAYQGLTGIGKTAVIGLIMALLTVFSGSLFVAMLLHSVIDLTSGRIMATAREKNLATHCP